MGEQKYRNFYFEGKSLEKVILDTNVLIEILKNNKNTIEFVENYNTHFISEITKMELFYGAFNKSELNKLKKFTELFEIIPIEKEISNLATKLIHNFAKSHNLNIPDALIAATSLHHNLNLISYNIKDFNYIDNLELIGLKI